MTQPILETIAAGVRSRTAFYIDGETMRAVLDAGVGVGSRFEIGLEIPFLLHSGGGVDSFIESYHDRFGFPDGGRPAFVSDRFAVGYVGDGESVFIDRAPGGFHLGDVVLSGRAGLVRGDRRRPAVAASASVKLPTGDPGDMFGSGSTDYGVSILVTQPLGRTTLHGGYAFTAVGEWETAPELPLSDSRSLFLAYAFAATPRTTLIGQWLRSSGPFQFRSGNDLGRVANEVAVGFRHLNRHDLALEWAFIENLNGDFNTPDVGIFVGLSLRPGAGPPSGPIRGDGLQVHEAKRLTRGSGGLGAESAGRRAGPQPGG
ncbi:MAG: DUF3187 family protein [Acidobacteriota bacterium]